MYLTGRSSPVVQGSAAAGAYVVAITTTAAAVQWQTAAAAVLTAATIAMVCVAAYSSNRFAHYVNQPITPYNPFAILLQVNIKQSKNI